MKLHELKPTPGSRHERNRVGRGMATGTVSYTHLTLPTTPYV